MVTSTILCSFRLPAVAAEDRLFFVQANATKTPQVSVFNPLPVLRSDVDYVVIGSRKQDNWALNGSDWATFRREPRHGSYRTAYFQVEDLANQYNYGLQHDARAIQNITAFGVRRGALEQVLLVGKGREFHKVRTPAQLAAPENTTYFVPTFGYPSSDNMAVADAHSQRMVVGVGRVAAESSAELDVLYQKTRVADEVLVDNPQLRGLQWTKDFFHLAGGTNFSQQQSIQVSFAQMSAALKRGELAPDIATLYKQATVPILSRDIDRVFDHVNQGLNTLVFYGHGSPTTFEINIKQPDRYNNTGKYPMLLAYGCYSGNCNLSIETIGETLIGLPQKGFVAFGAGTGAGYVSQITVLGTEFYRAFADTHYDEPIGTALRVAVNHSLSTTNAIQQQHGQQFLMQGDPALMMYKHRGPDVIFDETTFRVGNGTLSPEFVTFPVTIDLVNLGKSARDTFRIIVERESSARPRQVVDTLEVDGVVARKTLTFDIPSWGPEGAGFNRIWLRIEGLDAQAAVTGAFDNDSSGPLGFAVADSRITILYPAPLEVLASTQPTFYAESGNVWDEARSYDWQLSTSADFAAANTISESMMSKSLIRYTPQALQRNQLYHLRIKASGDSVWSTRTFRVGDTARVADLQQYEEFVRGTGRLLEPLADETWRFGSTGLNKALGVQALGLTPGPSFVTSFETQAVSIDPWVYSDTTITFLVADSLTGTEMVVNGALGSITAGPPDRAFTYHVTTPQQRARVAFLLDSIPKRGNFVYFWINFRNGRNFQPDSWVNDSLITGGRSLLGVLRENGAQRVDEWIAKGTVPYGIIWHEGIRVLAEDVGADSLSHIRLSVDLPVRSSEGSYRTPIVQHLRSVKRVSWRFEESKAEAQDLVEASLYGITPSLDTVLLLPSAALAVDYVLQDSDTSSYEQIFLSIKLKDIGLRTPVPLREFRIDGVLRPEVAFDPNVAHLAPADSIAPKGQINFRLGLRNVSSTPTTEPLLASVERLPSSTLISADTFGVIPGFGAVTWTDTFALQGSGAVDLAFRLRRAEADTRHEANEIGYASTKLGEDKTVPDVTVLVEGERLRQRQLLAPRPVFRIEVRDDISLDSLNTESLSLALIKPSGERLVGQQLPGELTLVPEAGGSDRTKVWEYRPGELEDGIYGLTVSATDDRGNRSRNNELTYEFEIANAVAISNVLPYPNPMVDAVRFQYELTGEVPSNYQISIYSSSGRLVRSLGPQDLGALQVGRRMTQNTWNGTDEFGQRLARGVYLYRFEVTQSSMGEAFEHRATGAEQAVESGFGKLVIVR